MFRRGEYGAVMMTILDDPEARQSVFPLSVGFYHEAGRMGLIGEDVELLDGVLFKKMSKSPLHEWLADRLRGQLDAVCAVGFFVGKERPITCATSEPEPDLAVFAGVPGDFRHGHPTTAELVIEIAINTLQRDRSKAGIYARAGVKEYWLIEPEGLRVTLFTGAAGGEYAAARVFEAGQTASSEVVPGFVVEVAGLMG